MGIMILLYIHIIGFITIITVMVLDERKELRECFRTISAKNFCLGLFKMFIIGNLWLWCIPFYIYENWYRIKRYINKIKESQ
jgi:hypothetical protein